MFAKALNAARRVLSRSPSVQERASTTRESPPRSHEPEPAMVFTRSGAEATPLGSTRSTKRTLEAEDTPLASKRRRPSSKQSREAEDQGKTPDDVETYDKSPGEVTRRKGLAIAEPDEDTTIRKLPVRGRASPKVVISKRSPPTDLTPVSNTFPKENEDSGSSQDHTFRTPAGHRQSSVYETPATSKHAIQEMDETTPRPTSSRHKGQRGKSGKGQGTLEHLQDKASASAILSTQESATNDAQGVSSPPKKTHIRFESEESLNSVPITQNKQGRTRFRDLLPVSSEAKEDMESEDSDDDAPEAITTTSAISKRREAEANAARAYEAQEQKQKLKRKVMETRMQEEREQKRKRNEDKAKKRERNDAPHAPLETDLHSLPDLLPESLLEAAGDKRPPTPPRELVGKSGADRKRDKMNRHIRFLEHGEKSVKDVKKGRLNVHVLQQQNKFLAPKVNKDTKNIREQWMKGRQHGKRGSKGRTNRQFSKMERRPVGRGFIRGEDD
ncbi:hypothetical protein EJ04DRAFT_500054 [Polyplosphaeria fusca]|uniref:Uncharacterized protein n=1 Tax=Polyplosphaeria fusca TaxID=682080 RepID=A0A9P4QTI8_9PLEO|nr:hypothetical protein EJ04DRAFT_500054 [Polyplosphaeria fusca]